MAARDGGVAASCKRNSRQQGGEQPREERSRYMHNILLDNCSCGPCMESPATTLDNLRRQRTSQALSLVSSSTTSEATYEK